MSDRPVNDQPPIGPSGAPMALQVVVRVERSDPPTTTQAAMAASLSTIALLDDARSRPGGDWHEAVERWNGARIRKIVRRARASAWDRAQELDGVTITIDGVEARAFVPCPTDQVPQPIGRLQIQSSPLAEPERISTLPAELSAEGSGRPPSLLVAVTPEVEMSWGKVAAQCAHATQRAWMTTTPDRRAAWTDAGRPLRIVHPDAALWARVAEEADVQIRDGGFTEIPAGTRTTVARWIDPGR